MNRIVVTTTVGNDGNLHLDLPLGADEAGKEVQVTVEPIAADKLPTQEEWRAFVVATAGSVTDPTFERPPQGEFEEREPLP
jgi:hypothetical protein